MSILLKGLTGFAGLKIFVTSNPVTTDSLFQYVSLLLNGVGPNSATNNTVIDGSANNLTITRTGTPAQGTVSPFSQGNWEGTSVVIRQPSIQRLTQRWDLEQVISHWRHGCTVQPLRPTVRVLFSNSDLRLLQHPVQCV